MPRRSTVGGWSCWCADPATAPHADGVLVIDDSGDRKAGTKTAHVARQYLGSIGKVDGGIVAVTSLWADERVYYPLHVRPYTPAARLPKGKADPDFRTKPQLAVELVDAARDAGFSFRAVVADCFYGENATFEGALAEAGLPYVLALKPSSGIWAPADAVHTPEEAARELWWGGPDEPGDWTPVVRRFRDGHEETWWAADLRYGPYGPDRPRRVVVATTDPATLPPLTTWYLATNLPRPGAPHADAAPFAPADLAEIVRLYGLRNWVEQGYKQLKQELGWADFRSAPTRRSVGTGTSSSAPSPSAGGPSSPTASCPTGTARPAGRRPHGGSAGGDDRSAQPVQPQRPSRGRARCAGCGPGWARGARCSAAGGRGRLRPRRPSFGCCLTRSPPAGRSTSTYRHRSQQTTVKQADLLMLAFMLSRAELSRSPGRRDAGRGPPGSQLAAGRAQSIKILVRDRPSNSPLAPGTGSPWRAGHDHRYPGTSPAGHAARAVMILSPSTTCSSKASISGEIDTRGISPPATTEGRSTKKPLSRRSRSSVTMPAGEALALERATPEG